MKLTVRDGRVHRLEASPKRLCPGLIDMLQRQDRIPVQRADQIRQAASKRGWSEAKSLMQMAHTHSTDALADCIRAYQGRLVQTMRATNFTRAAYYELDALPEAAGEVSAPLLESLFCRFKKRLERDGGDVGEDFKATSIVAKPCAGVSINTLGLSLPERQFFDVVLQKRLGFDTLLRISTLPKGATIHLLGALRHIGALYIDADDVTGTPSSPEQVAENVRCARALERLDSLEAKLDQKNPFDVMDLHWTSYDALVEGRARSLLLSLKTLNQPLGMSDRDRQRLQKCREGVAQAYNALSNPAERMSWRQRRVRSRAQAQVVDELERRVVSALEEGARASARDYCQRLLELCPRHQQAGRLLPQLLGE